MTRQETLLQVLLNRAANNEKTEKTYRCRLDKNQNNWQIKWYKSTATDYFLTQAHSAHNCFRNYKYNRQRSETPNFPQCKANGEHTLLHFPRWDEVRTKHLHSTRQIFNTANMSYSEEKPR